MGIAPIVLRPLRQVSILPRRGSGTGFAEILMKPCDRLHIFAITRQELRHPAEHSRLLFVVVTPDNKLLVTKPRDRYQASNIR